MSLRTMGNKRAACRTVRMTWHLPMRTVGLWRKDDGHLTWGKKRQKGPLTCWPSMRLLQLGYRFSDRGVLRKILISASIPAEWGCKKKNKLSNRKVKFLIYLNFVSCATYTYNQRSLLSSLLWSLPWPQNVP